MCNELKQVGLKYPVYHTNAFCCRRLFIIQNMEKLLLKKRLFIKKLALAVNKSLIDSQKPAIGEEKLTIDDKKPAVDRIKSAIEQQRYNETLKANILKEYDEIEKKRIFQS